MYGMVYTRLDISHEVGDLSKYMSKPWKEYWAVVKRAFRYLYGTTNYGIFYQGRPRVEKALDMHGFVDVD
jgi:hypothetical protein